MWIQEKAKDTPVFYEADLCVLGGSCTGVFAAVRAARLGLKVVIVEKQNAFGGVAASGLVNIWHSLKSTTYDRQIIAGLTLEMIERLKRLDAVVEKEERGSNPGYYILNTEELKIELDKLVAESQVKVYFHTMFVAPYVNDGQLEAVIVENKSGRGAIKAKMFIDATGDGDLCDRLGMDQRLSPLYQPSTACAKISGWEEGLNNNELGKLFLQHKEEFNLPEGTGWGAPIPGTNDIYMYAGTRVYHANSSDGDQLTYSEIEGRRQIRAIMDLLRKYADGNRMSLVSLPSYIGTRETRHISCQYQLTGEDVLYGRRFDDAIANGSYRVDIHHQEKPGLTFKYLNGVEVYSRPGHPSQVGRWRDEMDVDPTFYQIPYRSLLPQGPYPNVMVAGRMLDIDDEAFGGVRVMVNMNQLGEAAGVAAYLGMHQSKGFADIDVQELRNGLTQGGSIVI